MLDWGDLIPKDVENWLFFFLLSFLIFFKTKIVAIVTSYVNLSVSYLTLISEHYEIYLIIFSRAQLNLAQQNSNLIISTCSIILKSYLELNLWFVCLRWETKHRLLKQAETCLWLWRLNISEIYMIFISKASGWNILFWSSRWSLNIKDIKTIKRY